MLRFQIRTAVGNRKKTPVAYNPWGCSSPQYAMSTTITTGATCPASETGVYSLGAQVTTVYSMQFAYYDAGTAVNTCKPQAPVSGYSYFTVGAEIPASSFVAATQSHD